MKKKIIAIFIFAFLTNVIWENLHSFLYVHFDGGDITQFILLRSSFMDAVMITLILLPFLYLDFFKKNSWFILVIGILLAIIIELSALFLNLWSYKSFMPIIPYLKVGLTPTIQLGLLGYLSFRFGEYIK